GNVTLIEISRAFGVPYISVKRAVYWVNDAIGQPFFVVSKTVDPGMLKVLRTDIIPRLLEDVPNQPTESELEIEEFIFRFGIVFDREGYSPAFFKEIWIEHRIVCYTYRKNVKNVWPEEEFKKTKVIFPNGEESELILAERKIYREQEKMDFMEIRKLTETNHQTALITTDFHNTTAVIAGKMFARWSQENFFKYMMQHVGIDRLIGYELDNIDETVSVVNPAWRKVDKEIRSQGGKLSKKKAEYGNLMYENENTDKKNYDYHLEKSLLFEEIMAMEKELEELKIERKKEEKRVNDRKTVRVVNPQWRKLDSEIRSKRGKLSRMKAKYGNIVYKDEIKDNKIQNYVQKKSLLLEEIQDMEKELEELKVVRKKEGKHIEFSKLSEDQKFKEFKKSGKQFIDTIKMIAYRAETALVSVLKEFCSNRKDDLRSIVRQIFMTDADLEPDEENGVLKISLHNMSTPRNNRYFLQLCEVLNESETTFPGTNLRLLFNLVSNNNHAVPEV
ncbi:MAG: hypothetical protein GY866_34575, partial [Proteobacteria bacterium]|nr:hypothetical protein [Pseudomonadota bacterium]